MYCVNVSSINLINSVNLSIHWSFLSSKWILSCFCFLADSLCLCNAFNFLNNLKSQQVSLNHILSVSSSSAASFWLTSRGGRELPFHILSHRIWSRPTPRLVMLLPIRSTPILGLFNRWIYHWNQNAIEWCIWRLNWPNICGAIWCWILVDRLTDRAACSTQLVDNLDWIAHSIALSKLISMAYPSIE